MSWRAFPSASLIQNSSIGSACFLIFQLSPYPRVSGALGAGLAIFTRFPIVTTSVNPYSLNGSPIDVAAGDWFVGKAAASVTILHPVLGLVQIFNTHVCSVRL